MSPTHNERALPDLHAMLGLSFVHVIISHGEPLHAREAFERALELPPWPATPLHQAAYGGNFERVRTLVEAGADVTARDELYNVLLWAGLSRGARQNWAEGRGHQQLIGYLKSEMNQADRRG